MNASGNTNMTEKGRVVEEWQESVAGGHKYEWYEYEYDEYGNVCKKTDVLNKTTYEYLPLSSVFREKLILKKGRYISIR